MNIHKGDTVQIMTGKDRGKRGKILVARPHTSKVIIENLNLAKKHSRPKTQGAKGEIVHIAKPIPAANVRLVCSSCNRPVRAGIRPGRGGRERYCKKCKSVL